MKLITETDCPHCKKPHEAELDLENLELPPPERSQMKVKSQVPTTAPDGITLDSEPQVITKVKIPGHIPKYKCKNCDKAHDNPDYKLRPRFKCSNCGQLNPTAQCQFCDKAEDFEELSDDDLDEMGIKAPEHKHEHEE